MSLVGVAFLLFAHRLCGVRHISYLDGFEFASSGSLYDNASSYVQEGSHSGNQTRGLVVDISEDEFNLHRGLEASEMVARLSIDEKIIDATKSTVKHAEGNPVQQYKQRFGLRKGPVPKEGDIVQAIDGKEQEQMQRVHYYALWTLKKGEIAEVVKVRENAGDVILRKPEEKSKDFPDGIETDWIQWKPYEKVVIEKKSVKKKRTGLKPYIVSLLIGGTFFSPRDSSPSIGPFEDKLLLSPTEGISGYTEGMGMRDELRELCECEGCCKHIAWRPDVEAFVMGSSPHDDERDGNFWRNNYKVGQNPLVVGGNSVENELILKSSDGNLRRIDLKVVREA